MRLRLGEVLHNHEPDSSSRECWGDPARLLWGDGELTQLLERPLQAGLCELARHRGALRQLAAAEQPGQHAPVQRSVLARLPGRVKECGLLVDSRAVSQSCNCSRG